MATITIPVPFEKDPGQPMNLSAVLADTKGNILQQSPLSENGEASFDESLLQRGNIQIAVLPNVEDNMEGIKTLEQISRFKPYISSLAWDKANQPILKPVPAVYFDWWAIRFCRVLGLVSKNFLINNVWKQLPVCHARVHICEVDKIFWLIRKIPDHVILRIPELIEKVPPKPPVLFPTNIPIITRPNVLTTFPGIPKAAEPIIKLDSSIAGRFNTQNPEIIRNEVVNNFQLLRPYFCRIPWLWPYFYRCDEIKTVFTDDNGRFDTSIIYFAGGDKPDIYVWVECLINGVWTTVYRPSIACNTRWDYACGTDININITDERVTPGCGNNLQGEALWVRSIGNYSIRDVLQVSSNAPIQGVPFERKGLFKYGSDYRSPFATTTQSARMNFGVIFGSGLPVAGAKYFRWACRKVANEVMVPQFGPTIYLIDNISRAYLVEHHIGGTINFQVRSVDLGPVSAGSVNGLFYIPPVNPVGFLGITDSVGWMSMSTITSNLDTSALSGDGLYEFWLEIFDSAGNRINPSASFFQIPKATDFLTSENASGDYFAIENGMNAFKMVVRIDSLNNKTVAEIYPVRLTASPGSYVLSNPCGFLDYTDDNAKNISIPFKAYQANNFADFSFSVGRGNAGTGAFPTVASVSGMVIGNAGRYVRDSNGVYMPDDSPDLEFTAAELMQTCTAGGRAAFTEGLYVAALHTDGYRRLNELDSSSSAAFALSRR